MAALMDNNKLYFFVKNDVPIYSTHTPLSMNVYTSVALGRVLRIVWPSCELNLASAALDGNTSL